MGKVQIEHSDITQEQKLAEDFIRRVAVEKRIPTSEEIAYLLQDGWVVMCNVNARRLNNREGYAGHFVIVKGVDDGVFIIHDPGLPPQENRRAPFDLFERAWAYPDERTKNIMAFRRQGKTV